MHLIKELTPKSHVCNIDALRYRFQSLDLGQGFCLGLYMAQLDIAQLASPLVRSIICRMSRPLRQRSITVLVLIASLLFQQGAMAAFACTMTKVSTDPAATAQDCEAMASQQTRQSSAVCQKHCAPDPTSANTQNLLAVPALALPPVSFGLAISQGAAQAAFVSDVAFARSDPPSRLRYCRLLI